jgi:hypothetical protein
MTIERYPDQFTPWNPGRPVFMGRPAMTVATPCMALQIWQSAQRADLRLLVLVREFHQQRMSRRLP